MDLRFTKDIDPSTGYNYKKGDVVESAEDIFGVQQAKYFIETEYAEAVGKKTEKATAKAGETPEK